MKVAVLIEYVQDHEKIRANYPAHHEYLQSFLTNGALRAAGPLAGDAGALWVLDVETAETAEGIVKGDPYVAAGVIVNWTVRSLAYWSAKEAKVAR